MVGLVRLHQRICKPDHSLLPQRSSIGKTASSHISKGQECSPSVTVLFQKFDHMLGCLVIVRDNVLNTASQSRLYRHLILFFYPDQVCHYPVNTRTPLLLLHHSSNTVSISLIPLCDVFQRFQSGFLPVISCLTDLHLSVLILQQLSDGNHFLLRLLIGLIQLIHLPADLLVFSLMLFYNFLLFRFITF